MSITHQFTYFLRQAYDIQKVLARIYTEFITLLRDDHLGKIYARLSIFLGSPKVLDLNFYVGWGQRNECWELSLFFLWSAHLFHILLLLLMSESPSPTETSGSNSPPPSKRVKLDTIDVSLSGESITVPAGAFQRLESFVTDKINSSDKKARYAYVVWSEEELILEK